MTEVIVSKSINAPAKSAWEKLSSFRGIEEISVVERSVTVGHGVGATRTCYLPDGAEIYELMDQVNNESMEMQYRITEGPFPITGYISNVKVEETGEMSCKITWGCQFEANENTEEKMVELFEGFYNDIISNLETLITNQN